MRSIYRIYQDNDKVKNAYFKKQIHDKQFSEKHIRDCDQEYAHMACTLGFSTLKDCDLEIINGENDWVMQGVMIEVYSKADSVEVEEKIRRVINQKINDSFLKVNLYFTVQRLV